MIASLEESQTSGRRRREGSSRLFKAGRKIASRSCKSKLWNITMKKDSMLEKAADEAAAIVENAKKEAEEIIHDLAQTAY